MKRIGSALVVAVTLCLALSSCCSTCGRSSRSVETEAAPAQKEEAKKEEPKKAEEKKADQ